MLEIETNDILRCGHGATAGAIDPTQLFYAQTRGLDPDAAERMIVRGFFEQVVGQIHDETIRERDPRRAGGAHRVRRRRTRHDRPRAAPRPAS